MKTTHYLYMALCLSAISAVSCTKESNGETPVTEFEKCDIQAIAEQTTKTHISDLTAGTVAWDSGDALSVFSENIDSGINNKFTSSDISGSKSSVPFSGNIDSGTTSFYAVYPYNANMTYSKGKVSNAVIPSTQTATDNSFANGVSLSIAKGTKTPGKSDCGTLTFENLCAVLAFTLPSNITFANEIIVSSKSGANMAGSVTIDCANKTVSGASDASVKLSGSFTGGNTYMVAIAPGTYTGGFSFTINTKGGNSYTRGTTKDLTAQSGKMYNLGKLSLEIAEADLSTSVTISHDIASGVLNGSTAKFSITPKSEFASAISKYKAVVTLKDSSSTVCRTLSKEATTISNTNMDMTNNFYYLPKGDYTYEATVTYYVSNDSKLVEHTYTYSGKVNSPQPSGFANEATPTGYTSYSCYAGTDGQTANATNANNCDNATIYGIGAKHKGLSDDVSEQCSNLGLLTYSSTLDGTAASGNKDKQTWAAHTIGATVSFEGVTSAAATKKVYITGLPYNVAQQNMKKVESDWTIGDDKEYKYEKEHLYMRGKIAGTKKTSATFKGFCVPDNIDVNAIYKVGRYGLTCPQTLIFKVGETTLKNESGKDSWTYWTSPNDAKLTPSNNTVYASISGTSTSWATGQCKVQYVKILYR